MYRIGIDLGGTNIAVGIVDETQTIVAAASMPTVAKNGADAVLDDIAQCVLQAHSNGGLDLKACSGAGIGVPGTCDTQRGIVRYAHNIGWDGVPVTRELRRRLGLPVFLANDADCAALGEVVGGAAKGCGSALMVTLGTGVGGGFVVNGQIWSGHGGLGGEFGHMCIELDGEACSCGRRGCWEAYASATALIRQAKKAAAAHPESTLNVVNLNGRTIYEAAAAGDETACAVTARYASYVGVGLVNFINALFPEVILLGGGVSGAGDALLVPVREYVRDHAFVRDPALLPEIRAAALGGDAGIIGAAALVKE